MSFGRVLRDLTDKNKLELELKPLADLIKQRCLEEAKRGRDCFRIDKSSDEELRKVQHNIKKMEELLTDDCMVAKYNQGSYFKDGNDWCFIITW